MPSSAVFQGLRERLVLAFDVGTTYSGISYSVLIPGRVPEIKGVTKFPGLEVINGSSKIPTIIYYDRTGNVRAVGAGATREGIYEMAEDEQWVKAEWFKLHLRSKFGAGSHVATAIPPLPPNKTIVQVLADFLKYLFDCASCFIKKTHTDGADLWGSVSDEIEFVFSHPNGWEGKEQGQMRAAAVLAGLIPDNFNGHARLSYVTEGEASLHFTIQNGLPDSVTKQGEGIVIVDAGGGTIDVSSYAQSSTGTFEEIAAPQCYFLGSVFVTVYARIFLENVLSDSRFSDDVDYIAQCFDKVTKLKFENAEETQYVIFGSRRDNDPTCNIRFGQLKLSESDVSQFFEPSADCIVNAVLEQQKTARKPISHAVLVGGFAANDWLYEKVQATLQPSGLKIILPQSHMNKAVSDGAISFYLNHFVRARVSKFTYRSIISTPFDPTDPDHQKRAAQVHISRNAEKYLKNAFSVILPKDTQISESTEFRRSFFVHASSTKSQRFCICFWCYRGTIPNPKWSDVDTENYTKVCSIEGDLSQLPLTPQINRETQKEYYSAEYSVILLFGLTELKAQIAWTENGVEKRSPAKIIYSSDT